MQNCCRFVRYTHIYIHVCIHRLHVANLPESPDVTNDSLKGIPEYIYAKLLQICWIYMSIYTYMHIYIYTYMYVYIGCTWRICRSHQT
jgi:hypothetical protein